MGNGTSIGRVRGLGSSHGGTHEWIIHRLTAISNLVLMTWFIVSLLALPDYRYETVTAWLSSPLGATAMILLVISLFWHARMGLQIVIEDYIHDAGSKFGILAIVNLAIIGGAAFAIFSIASLAFGANS